MASAARTSVLDDPLLATKLYVPRPPSQLVRRSQLTERLQQAVERQLTLIAAPAGFGKTTLLSAWLQEAPVLPAWVSLDSGDDDPTRFWSYTLAALVGNFLGRDIRTALRALPLVGGSFANLSSR